MRWLRECRPRESDDEGEDYENAEKLRHIKAVLEEVSGAHPRCVRGSREGHWGKSIEVRDACTVLSAVVSSCGKAWKVMYLSVLFCVSVQQQLPHNRFCDCVFLVRVLLSAAGRPLCRDLSQGTD